MRTKTIYQQNGYENRYDYLTSLAEEYEIDLDTVEELAGLLGQDEDFDGLVNAIQDM